MKVTVFGGSGFLGSHVCDKLMEVGHEVRIFDIKPSPWLKTGQEMIVGDILDRDKVNQAIKGAQVVFNFAGVADIGEANEKPVETVRYNILGNTIILDGCRAEKIKRYIFASTIYVYSKSGGFYRCSKQSCEQYIEAYHEAFDLDFTILRYGSLYGPRADERNAIYRFVKQALTDKKISYFGGPDSLREYIHVEDAALCSVEIMKKEYANQSIVLTGNQKMKVGDLMSMIAEMLKMDIKLEFDDNPSNIHYKITPYSFSPRTGKKFSPPLHMDLGQGILRVIEDVYSKSNPDLDNRNGILIKE